MKIKKGKKGEILCILFCCIMMVLILVALMPATSKAKEAVWQDNIQNDADEIPMITVREDSLQKVLSYFTAESHSIFNVTYPADDVFALHLGRFSSNPGIFYSSNAAIIKKSGSDFRIEVTSGKEINAQFSRIKRDNVYYVKLPTDVLFGLMKLHPNIQ